MRIDRRLTLFLLFYGCLLLIPIWQLSLIESTEARYGEIAREMLASGNFLEPTFNGIFHFHKPPVPYWCMAAGMAIFGVNDFGVRFFGIVAAVISLYFLFRTARIFFDDRDQSFAVVLTLASSPLFIAISRAVSTDIYLTCCVIGAQFFLFRQVYGERSTGNAIGYGLLLGFGFMVKGPVIFLFTLLPQLAVKTCGSAASKTVRFQGRALRPGLFSRRGATVVCRGHSASPGSADLFHQGPDSRSAGYGSLSPKQAVLVFSASFPGNVSPLLLPLMRGVWRFRECPPRIRALMIYVFLPLLVFCFSKSKLPPYILPFYGTAALLAVYSYRELRSEWDDRLTFAVMMILACRHRHCRFRLAPFEPSSLESGIRRYCHPG